MHHNPSCNWIISWSPAHHNCLWISIDSHIPSKGFKIKWLIRITFTYFSSKSGDISDMATQFPMSSSSKLSFTGRSLFMLVTYTQLLTFRSLRCCSPSERGNNNDDDDASMLLKKEKNTRKLRGNRWGDHERRGNEMREKKQPETVTWCQL